MRSLPRRILPAAVLLLVAAFLVLRKLNRQLLVSARARDELSTMNAQLRAEAVRVFGHLLAAGPSNVQLVRLCLIKVRGKQPRQAALAHFGEYAPIVARQSAHLQGSSPRGWLFACLRVISITGTVFIETKVPSRAAALSFSSLLSLGPLIAIAVLVGGFILGKNDDPNLVANQVGALLEQVAPQLRSLQTANNADATIGEAVIARRAGIGSAREVVDLVFDAFDREGAGALASWMLLSGNEDALDPIIEAIHRLVDEISEDGQDDTSLHELTLEMVLVALGDALLGGPMSASLGLPRETGRQIAGRKLAASLDEWQSQIKS